MKVRLAHWKADECGWHYRLTFVVTDRLGLLATTTYMVGASSKLVSEPPQSSVNSGYYIRGMGLLVGF